MTRFILTWLLILAGGVLGSCSSTKQATKGPSERPYKVEAVKRYVDGLINELTGNPDAALRDYQVAVLLDSTSNTMYASLADQYALGGQTEKSLGVVQKILSANPTHIGALEILAELRIQSHDFNGAVETLEKIAEIKPGDIDAHYRLITIYEVQQKFAEAAVHYETLLRLLGPNTLLYLKLGDLFMKMKQYTKAAAVFREARASDPNNYFVLEALGQACEFNKQIPEALEAYEALAVLQESNHLVFFKIGSLALQIGDMAKAERAFKSADALRADVPEVQRSIAYALDRQNKRDDAILYYEKALRLNERDVLSMTLLAPLYQDKAWTRRADSLFERILELEPDNDLILNNYSYSLAQRNLQLDKALRLVQRALKKEPKSSHYLDTIGWVYFQMGLYDLALKYIRQSLEFNPDSWEVLDHLGDVYQKLNRTSDAQTQWKKALDLNPDHEGIRKKLRQ